MKVDEFGRPLGTEFEWNNGQNSIWNFFDFIDQRDTTVLKQSRELAPSNKLWIVFFLSTRMQLMAGINFNKCNGHTIQEGSVSPDQCLKPAGVQ